MPTCDRSHIDAAWWAAVIEPDDVFAAVLRDRLGDEEAQEWATRDQPTALPPDLPGHLDEWTRAWQRWHPRAAEANGEAEISRALSRGIRFLIPSDPQWPDALDDLEVHAPAGIWVRGDATGAPAAGIVGARASTASGNRTAADIACEMAEKGWTIVSGGAFGIDIAAHTGALAARGTTIAVMAGGLFTPYPQAHAGHFERILDGGGALISEVPPTWRPAKWRFLGRNRLIAALGRGTLVVEAGMRSGALATARRALELGRPVGAVPGPLTSTASAGCHELMRNGATLIRNATDFIELCDPIGAHDQDALFGAPVAEDSGADALPVAQRRVWEALPARNGATLSRLARAAGMGEREVLTALAELELAGRVESGASGWRRRR